MLKPDKFVRQRDGPWGLTRSLNCEEQRIVCTRGFHFGGTCLNMGPFLEKKKKKWLVTG